jgi:hypothetical protein
MEACAHLLAAPLDLRYLQAAVAQDKVLAFVGHTDVGHTNGGHTGLAEPPCYGSLPLSPHNLRHEQVQLRVRGQVCRLAEFLHTIAG